MSFQNGELDAFAGISLNNETTLNHVSTNYLACSGAASGGEHPDETRQLFSGIMQSRISKSPREIRDGLSQMVLFGESIGWIENGERVTAQSWIMGGMARGRSNLPWMVGIDPDVPHRRMLGNSQNAFAYGFGSMHKGIVNFCYGDGSVLSINREVNWKVYYRKCGANDSQYRF